MSSLGLGRLASAGLLAGFLAFCVEGAKAQEAQAYFCHLSADQRAAIANPLRQSTERDVQREGDLKRLLDYCRAQNNEDTENQIKGLQAILFPPSSSPQTSDAFTARINFVTMVFLQKLYLENSSPREREVFEAFAHYIVQLAQSQDMQNAADALAVYERETIAYGITGQFTPEMITESKRAFAEMFEHGRLVSPGPPVEEGAATTAIHKLYSALGLPSPEVVVLKPSIKLDTASLPPPRPVIGGPDIGNQFLKSRLGSIENSVRPAALFSLGVVSIRERKAGTVFNTWWGLNYVVGEKIAPSLASRPHFLFGQEDDIAAPGIFGAFERAGLTKALAPGQRDLFDAVAETWKAAGYVQCFDTVAIVLGHPKTMAFDEKQLLHKADGPAVTFHNGLALYFWHGYGLSLTADVIEHPERITIGRIMPETDGGLRGVMIERYGFDRFIKDSGAVLVSQEGNATLWRVQFSNPGDRWGILRIAGDAPEFRILTSDFPSVREAARSQDLEIKK